MTCGFEASPPAEPPPQPAAEEREHGNSRAPRRRFIRRSRARLAWGLKWPLSRECARLSRPSSPAPGWADFGRQLAIWFGFLVAYQVARGIADRNPPRAFDNGLHVIGIERHAPRLFELSLQRLVDGSHLLATLASWTYWNSEFTVLGLALLWVYLRRNEAFVRFRNTILLANVIGLVGYVLLPTAPPRMFPDFGFDDTLRSSADSTTAAASSSSPPTRTRRCRACTRPTR